MEIKDMPKLESPYVRKLNEKGQYICTPEITEGYDWVFEDNSVLAIEKLHGTNVSIAIEEGTIRSIWNRTERLPFFNKGKGHIISGLLNSYERGYMEFLDDGQWFGELIGPKINGNPYGLEEHLWIPFKTYAKNHLAYKSWGKYPKTYEAISEWFKELQPLYSWKLHGQKLTAESKIKAHFVEGIVFSHPDGRMAKLRRDMFEFYYANPDAKSHKEE